MVTLTEIDRFLRQSGLPPTRFGRDAVNDPKLVKDMRAGRQLRDATSRRLRAYMATVERDG